LAEFGRESSEGPKPADYTLWNPLDPSPVLKPSAKAHEDSQCHDCHTEHADKDNVRVQFHPTLRKLLPWRWPPSPVHKTPSRMAGFLFGD
jgi:hypothetical protein